jgi:arylsulfatase
MNRKKLSSVLAVPLLLSAMSMAGMSHAADKPPNILVIMGDDIGWSNIGVYNQGMMAGRTPHLDQLANEGMRLPTITPRPVARPDAPTSSPANCRSVPA